MKKFISLICCVLLALTPIFVTGCGDGTGDGGESNEISLPQAEEGKTKCSICLAKIRNKRERNKSDLLRSERKAYGICYICGKNPLLKDKGVCQKCYDVRLESIQKIMYLPGNDYWNGLNKLVFTKQGD